jgi:lactate dehydrogenase-like 2-hydroxyacid dehydrogenase
MAESRPKILVTRRMPPNVEARVTRDYDAALNEDDHNVSSEEILEGAQGRDGIICCSTEKFSPDLIAALPDSVRILATFSVGYEHIDIPAAKARGLKVTNTPDVLTDATADIAMLCLLAAARRGSEGDRLVRNDGWKGWHTTWGASGGRWPSGGAASPCPFTTTTAPG